MKQFSLCPTISQYDDCARFVSELSFSKDDLILTNKYIFKPHFSKFNLPCDVIYQESYGSGEPSDDMLTAILSDIHREYRRIIAIGGGTILDISKLLTLKNCNYVEDLYMGYAEPEKMCKLVAVPTTCGTGSEVTNVAVLALNRLNIKKGLAHPALFSDKVALIPSLLVGLPFRFFATSSIDALVHAFESVLSPKASAFSKAYGYQAIDMILRGYQVIVANGEEARMPLLPSFLVASTMAGISFGNAGCAAVHALSYPLGAKYHIAHGESNYAIFLGVMRYYMEHSRQGEIFVLNSFVSQILGCEPDSVYDALEELLSRILEHRPLHAYSVTEQDLSSFTDSVTTNQVRLMQNSFIPLEYIDILNIYRKLF